MSTYPLSPLESPRGPLHGAGIIITRPARQAAGFAQQLSALGATPIIFPAIVILPPGDRAPLERVHAALATYDMAIFVSANAAEYGVPRQPWPPRVAVFAPGPGTAAALAAAGVPNVRIPEAAFDTEGMLAMPELNHLAGRRILIFRGDGGRELLGDTLRARGARVEYVNCYRRAPPHAGAAGLIEVLRERRAHALTLTSSEGLDNLCALLDTEARALLQGLPAFVPHPRIAKHARTLGFNAVATDGADAGIIAGLLEWFASHSLPQR